MPDVDLERMVSDLRYVRDRWDILDCINRQSRGHDRHDVDVMAATYHADGVDEHGPTVKTLAEYGDWANALHGAAFEQHNHNVTTHTCDIDGETAHCESYVIVAGRRGNLTILMGGRYLDRPPACHTRSLTSYTQKEGLSHKRGCRAVVLSPLAAPVMCKDWGSSFYGMPAGSVPRCARV